MTETQESYRELLEGLDALGIRPDDLNELLRGKRSLKPEGAALWTGLAMAFNREAFPNVASAVGETEGLRVIVTEPDTSKMLDLVKRALLYTDMTVIFSGRAAHVAAFDPLLEGVRRGGVVCDGVPEWFRDLLVLRPLLVSGYGVCVQKHYFDLHPEDLEPRWVLSDLAHSGDRTASLGAACPEPNPYSVYADLLRPAELDCIYLGCAYEEWKKQLLASFKSARELAFATLLHLDLPYLSRVPLETLVEVRADEPDAFRRARAYLWDAVRECLKFDVKSAGAAEFARYVELNYLNPLRREAQDGIREAASRKLVRRCGPVISTLSLTLNALVGNPIGLLLDGLRLAQEGAAEFIEGRSEKLRKTGNDLYLFDRLEELAGAASTETTQ